MAREDDRELYKRAQQAWEAEDWPRAAELWERLARRYPDIPTGPVRG
ncbi:hypothetical protein ONA91_03430 [Micromonospora sp. DR5-3]|nr:MULTISPECIES: hypothetical protein [unclassified Micromonospora]MCW3813512.1 hypothetical protein [Micromonospora sp. DR5-3]